MARNRICYGVSLMAALAFYLFYTDSLSLLVLALTVALPLVSLAAGLAGRKDGELELAVPDALKRGEPAAVELRRGGGGSLRMRCRLRQENLLTGRQLRSGRLLLRPGQERLELPLLCDHCGGVRCTVERAGALDPLGLFVLPLEAPAARTVPVLPRALEPSPRPAPPRPAVLRPRPGGGPAEDHDLRPFRPGDPMRSVHWKLSRKLGTPMVREPLEPRGQTALVTVELWGAPERLDGILDRLCYVIELLLDRGTPFWAACAGGKAALLEGPDEAEAWLRALLSTPAPTEAPKEELPALRADWSYRVRV